MRPLDILDAGRDYVVKAPNGLEEYYHQWIEYRALAEDGEHRVRIGFKKSVTYGRERRNVVLWIDGRLTAGFIGADDFDVSGDVLSEIILSREEGERMCCYPVDPVPERYTGLPVVGFPTRVNGAGVRNTWAVVANVADHRLMIALPALRRLERSRED
jgi:hypothetical protein